MAEGKLGVEIVPDESALEDVEDREIGVAGPSGLGGDSDGGGALAGIGRKLMLILGALGVLAQLDTIMELLDGIFRAIEVALLPLVALITAFLRPVLTKLLRLFADFSFDEAFEDFERIIGEIVSAIGEDINQMITTPGEFVSDTQRDFDRFGGSIRDELGDNQLFPGFETTGNDVLNLLAGNEFSNAGIQKFFSNNGEDVQNEDSPG